MIFFLLSFQPFLDPLPAWDYWPWLLLPLALGISIVYKSIKCKTMSTVPREAGAIALWIVGGMVCAGAVLWGVVEIVSRV
jgi:hypothetical protein